MKEEEDQLTLVEAAEAGLLAEVERLLRKEGADVNQVEVDDEDEDDEEGAKREGTATASVRRGTTALHWAALRGNMPMVELLLEAGADVAIPDEKGNTALHSACKRGRTGVVERLLRQEFIELEVNAKNDAGRTPLFLAVKHGHLALVPSLCAHGADVAIQCGKDKRTVLHLVAQSESVPVELVEDLLRDVRQDATTSTAVLCRKDAKGKTALHRAAKTGRKEIVEAFLAAGASSEMVLQKDLHGRTPVDVALEGGHEELLPSMLAAGERRVQALRGQDRALKQQIVSLERDLRVARQREREREGGGMP
ncbi:Histone-lysine N-methyltransferase ehmt2 [Balamuthia mandrillaris]